MRLRLMSKIFKIWRDDGVINFVIPTEALITMVTAMAIAHEKWACHVHSEWLSLVTDDLLDKDVGASDSVERAMIEDLRDKSLKTHPLTTVTNRSHIGDAETFEGHAYGTMHPVEFGAISKSAKMQLGSPYGTLPPNDPVRMTFEIFVESAKQFVRPAEQLAVAGKDVEA
jgi:hypothetical protein